MCGVASLIVRKLWGVTQIWLMILVRLWKTFRTAFSVCLYRLFEVSYGCLNIWGWYTHVLVASLIVRKLWGVTQIWLMILVRLWKTFRTAFSVCLYRLFEVSYGCLNIWVYTHVWSCLTNCEKTVRCDADLIDDSCEALKDLSNGVFRMSLSTFWGELWLFEYMGWYTHVWSCLTNCEKTVRCDADLIDDSCEALKDLSNGVFRMSLSTFWGELWLFEYMGVIHMCEVASLIVKNCEVWRRFDWWFLWGFERPFERRFPYVSIDFLRWAMAVWIYGWYTHVWSCLTNCEKTVRCDADLIDDSERPRTAFSVCLYRLFEVSYGCLNVWVIYTCVEVASLIVRKLWGVTQIWLMILVGFERPFERRIRMSLSTFWGELWLFEYMGVIYTCVKLPH